MTKEKYSMNSHTFIERTQRIRTYKDHTPRIAINSFPRLYILLWCYIVTAFQNLNSSVIQLNTSRSFTLSMSPSPIHIIIWSCAPLDVYIISTYQCHFFVFDNQRKMCQVKAVYVRYNIHLSGPTHFINMSQRPHQVP